MKASEKRLRQVFGELPQVDQQSLLSFAEFLYERSAQQRVTVEVNILPRPEEETVVGAMKRLSQSYPMLNKALLLSDGSSLMTQHLVNGRAAKEVIDELEALFIKHYDTFKEST